MKKLWQYCMIHNIKVFWISLICSFVVMYAILKIGSGYDYQVSHSLFYLLGILSLYAIWGILWILVIVSLIITISKRILAYKIMKKENKLVNLWWWIRNC